MIQIKNLHKSYKMGTSSLHVLKGINFNVEQGELVAIMGIFRFWKIYFIKIF